MVKQIDFGDLVEVSTEHEVVKGILMPSDNNYFVIKLDSGYNISIKKNKVKNIKLVKKFKEKRSKFKKIKFKKNLPTIAILHTGGTISSKVDYRTGGVSARFEPEELISMFPELSDIVNIKSNLIRNMWSDDLRFKHFSLIAREIEKEIKKGVDGIIVGIGTDNLAVAAAALSFILEDLPVPVLFVGAQRSSDRGSSDAAVNLICAALFIAKSDFSGVAICMHENSNDNNCLILPACKTRKLHTSRRDAFKVVNGESIAKINYGNKSIEFIDKNYVKKNKERKLIVRDNMEEKVGLLKISINMRPEQFEFFNKYKGLVIEGTGLGHTPGDVIDEYTKIHGNIMKSIRKLVNNNCVVVMTSQCLYGRVSMNVYSKGRDLLNIGVIPGEDMLAEVALVKLAWLLGNYDSEKARELVRENLRGEISERSLY